MNKAELDRLCADKTLESDTLEFKEALPGKGGPDGWHAGADTISDRARDAIVAEVIAFANAHGGELLLGIAETHEKPSRAEAVRPVPRCADLAERFKLMIRDCVEPQIPIVEVTAIVTDANGAGVVLFRAPRSRLAPHRLKADRHCYVRRADRCETMTMREIQDLTLNVDRGLSALGNRLEQRRSQFLARYPSELTGDTVAFRVTALPVDPIFIDRVHGFDALCVSPVPFRAKRGRRDRSLQVTFRPGDRFRPIIRGTMSEARHEHAIVRHEMHCDGLIEYQYFIGDRRHIYLGWLLNVAGWALLGAEKFRGAAGMPGAEFVLDVEFGSNLPEIEVRGYSDDGYQFGRLTKGFTSLPRYSVGAAAKFPSLMQLLDRDIQNACHNDPDEPLIVEI